MKTVYRIRDNVTGKFSTGGTTPTWDKKGKVWSTIAHVNSHLALVSNSYYRAFLYPESACVVEYEVTEVETASSYINSWQNAIFDKKLAKEKKRQEQRIEAECIRRRQEFDRLKAEFEPGI
jgi:hypothetical protein